MTAGGWAWYDVSMTPIELFTQGLGLQAPWRVSSSDFNVKDGLRLVLSCDETASLCCPQCGKPCPRYDATEREWQHLGFWQHATHLRARVPRVSCSEHGVRLVSVPWARPEMGFTLLFEAFALQLIKEMPVLAAARLLGVTDQRLWRLIHHHVDVSRSEQLLTRVTKIGIDETSANAKTPYITVVVDMDSARVVFATPGKDGATIEAFSKDFTEHGGDPTNITDVSSDMSAAFISGVNAHLPKAQITFDKFHVTKLVTEALDETPARTGQHAVHDGLGQGLPARDRTRLVLLDEPHRFDDVDHHDGPAPAARRRGEDLVEHGGRRGPFHRRGTTAGRSAELEDGGRLALENFLL